MINCGLERGVLRIGVMGYEVKQLGSDLLVAEVLSAGWLRLPVANLVSIHE